MRLFDTHTHPDDPAFDEDRVSLMESLPDAGVTNILLCGADLESSRRVTELAARNISGLSMIAAVGIHPHDADTADEAAMAELTRLAALPVTRAIGEIGLDYYYDNRPREVQRAAMARQIRLANELDLPVIFHIRDAWGDFFEVLKEEMPRRANMHCWSGSAESLKRCLDMGMMIAYGGAVTFKNARNLRETVSLVPDDRLLIETDCPYLTPVPFRGKRNDPSKVFYVAKCLAEVRLTTLDAITELTYHNACRFFGVVE